MMIIFLITYQIKFHLKVKLCQHIESVRTTNAFFFPQVFSF